MDLKRYIIFGVVLLVVVGSLFLPKILNNNNNDEIRYKQVLDDEIPEKIKEMLPTYIMEERALTCKYEDEIYIIVARGEKKSKGYNVEIEKIIKENIDKDKFDIRVFAEFEDPKIDEVLPQEYSYPYTVVKTKLKNMPEEIHLDIEYDD